jgi:hypothetical protein
MIAVSPSEILTTIFAYEGRKREKKNRISFSGEW